MLLLSVDHKAFVCNVTKTSAHNPISIFLALVSDCPLAPKHINYERYMPSKWENATLKYVKIQACHAQISNYNATLASKLLSYQDISKIIALKCASGKFLFRGLCSPNPLISLATSMLSGLSNVVLYGTPRNFIYKKSEKKTTSRHLFVSIIARH